MVLGTSDTADLLNVKAFRSMALGQCILGPPDRRDGECSKGKITALATTCNTTSFRRTATCSILVGIALALRLGYVAYSGGEPMFPDEYAYAELAEHFRSYGAPPSDASRPPLYPALLSLAPGGERWTLTARMAQSALGAATVGLLYLVARRLWGVAEARLAGAVLAIHPWAVFFGAHLMIETLLIALMVAQLASFLRLWDRTSVLDAAATGFLGGLTSLVQAGHLAFVLPGAALVVAPPASRGRRVTLALVYVLSFAIPVVAWVARQYRDLGVMVPIAPTLGANLYAGFEPAATGRNPPAGGAEWPVDPGLTAIERDRALQRLAWQAIAADPPRVLRLMLKKVAVTWNPLPNWEGARKLPYQLASGLVCVPILLGALASPWLAPRGPRLWVLWAPVIYYTALHAVLVGSVRYRMPFEPSLILLSSAAWVSLARGFALRHAPAVAGTVLPTAGRASDDR